MRRQSWCYSGGTSAGEKGFAGESSGGPNLAPPLQGVLVTSGELGTWDAPDSRVRGCWRQKRSPRQVSGTPSPEEVVHEITQCRCTSHGLLPRLLSFAGQEDATKPNKSELLPLETKPLD